MKSKYSYKNVDDDISKLKNEQYLQFAAEIAKKSTMTQKHGCIIVYKKQVIATGYNTMPHMYSRSLHAEINALNKVKHKQSILKDSDMYIVRIGTDLFDNVLKYSKPCEDCTRHIVSNKIRRVFYSTNYEFDTFIDNRNRNQNNFNYPSNDKIELFQNLICDACC